MIFKRKDLQFMAGEIISIDEQLEFDLSTLKHNTLRKLENVEVVGELTYDAHDDRVYINLEISGDMTLPDSITNEDVLVPFVSDVSEIVSFIPVDDDEQNVLVVKNDMVDLNPIVFANIMGEIPLRVSKDGKKVYPKGEGWEVLSEEDFNTQDKPIDPRLAKLKDFKFDK